MKCVLAGSGLMVCFGCRGIVAEYLPSSCTLHIQDWFMSAICLCGRLSKLGSRFGYPKY